MLCEGALFGSEEEAQVLGGLDCLTCGMVVLGRSYECVKGSSGIG